MNIFNSIICAAALLFSVSAWGGPVNINQATADQLADAIKGVGVAKAAAIVSYRDQHGSFQSIDELVNVPGIGLKTLEDNRSNLTVTAAKLQGE